MGTAHGLKNHVQALEPPRFRNMLDELTKIFTFVVIDGPPVNLHSESTLLGPRWTESSWSSTRVSPGCLLRPRPWSGSRPGAFNPR